MLGNRKLIVDEHSEVYRELSPWIDGEFWNLDQHTIVPGAIYIFCRESVNQWSERIKQLARDGIVTVVVDNAAEGSETMVNWVAIKDVADLVQEKKILLIGGGEMSPDWHYLCYEYFLPKILDFDENVETASRSDEIFARKNKPYKFLFLNGRLRNHRKYLLERFRLSGLLDQCLWTSLDTSLGLVRKPSQGRWFDYNLHLDLEHLGENLMERPNSIHYLPARYEAEPHRAQIGIEATVHQPATKWQLFNQTWGDAIVDGEAYRDTYFSLVTETVFNYPYSFRTEKIWKPVAVGHPFIAVANAGFYKDLHRMGFKTFGHVVDESFDSIDNNQDRIERITEVVEDLCQQDLDSFLAECYNVCKYNQEHYAEYRHRVPREFPEQFQQFIERYSHE
jgi:hypothetical protein